MMGGTLLSKLGSWFKFKGGEKSGGLSWGGPIS